MHDHDEKQPLIFPWQDGPASRKFPRQRKACKICGTTIMAYKSQKYCKPCAKIENDRRKAKWEENRTKQVCIDNGVNMFLKQSEVRDMIRFAGSHNVTIACKLCGRPYAVHMTAMCTTYPAFCEDHRNEYRRSLYTKEQMRIGVCAVPAGDAGGIRQNQSHACVV